MKTKHVLAGLAILAASLSASAVDFVEGFDDVAGLTATDWRQVNNGVAPTNPFFQGNAGVFPSQQGAADSYAGADFLSSFSGAIENWLISPLLALDPTSVLSFYTRTAGTDGFVDSLDILFSATGSTDLASFSLLASIGGAAGAYPVSWTQFFIDLPDAAFGRFAFRQGGTAETADYLGIDSVRVTNAVALVPEPSTYAMFAAGLAGLAWLRRRRARR